MSDHWKRHAYPLQQVTVYLQGTRHSKRDNIIEQLETVLVRLRNGEIDCNRRSNTRPR